jgi:hypothetical protein
MDMGYRPAGCSPEPNATIRRCWPSLWTNSTNLARCPTTSPCIWTFFDLADAIITLRSLIRRAWTTHQWDNRPTRRR